MSTMTTMAVASRRALEGLTRAHYEGLTSYATSLCRDRADANDLVQEALERAARRFESCADPANGRRWLFSIVHNAFIDDRRRRRRAHTSDGLERLPDTTIRLPSEEAEARAWERVTPEQLGAAIDALDEEFRVVYRMHAMERRSYDDISVALDIPINTVGTRLTRARRKLRGLLDASSP